MGGSEAVETALPSSIDETPSSLRGLSIRSEEFLRQLAANHNSVEEGRLEELTASFNIWMADVGALRTGQQSLDSRLHNVPHLRKMFQRLLLVLEHDIVTLDESLAKPFLQKESPEENLSASDSDDSSDRSSIFPLSSRGDDTVLPSTVQPDLWTPIQMTLTNLRQLALTFRLKGRAVYSQQPIDHFKNTACFKEECGSLYEYAYSKITREFPEATSTLQNRTVDSIAMRRARILHHGHHQISAAMLAKQPSRVDPSSGGIKNQLTRLFFGQDNADRASESAPLVKLSSEEFSQDPRLEPGDSSLTCPVCSQVFSVTDFLKYNPLLVHSKPEWQCWYCKGTDASVTRTFPTPNGLEDHLKGHHPEEVRSSLRHICVKHSMTRAQYVIKRCPFCGASPEEASQQYPNRNHYEFCMTLEKHIKNHLVSVARIGSFRGRGEPDAEIDNLMSRTHIKDLTDRREQIEFRSDEFRSDQFRSETNKRIELEHQRRGNISGQGFPVIRLAVFGANKALKKSFINHATGASMEMGRDKALFDADAHPQRQLLEDIVGRDYFGHVVFVYSRWDQMKAAAVAEFPQISSFSIRDDSNSPEARLHMYDRTEVSARAILALFTGYPPVIIELQRELVQYRGLLSRTTAGRSLSVRLSKKSRRSSIIKQMLVLIGLGLGMSFLPPLFLSAFVIAIWLEGWRRSGELPEKKFAALDTRIIPRQCTSHVPSNKNENIL
ncbi:hypothetical protein BJ166DRAFT_584113 [Pestalotiopsis sp. NC0098]|nr:hypothetical protein BJ166DRAFT_584113 [Pestalotiopsis sp. NC0098]